MNWPEGKACAFALTVDFDAEEVWIGDDPDNAGRPGVLSQGTYGANVGVPLLLEMVESLRAPATFFVPGRVAERHRERVAAIIAAGHEVAVHGYTHRSPTSLTEEEERRELESSLDVLRDLGAEPAGYRSPSWDLSSHTLKLLDDESLKFTSNLMDDIRPYRHPGTGLIELPVHWSLDDAPHFWFSGQDWDRKIATPREVREIWQAEFEGIRRLGGLCVLVVHPQLIGRPGRIGMLGAFLEEVMSHPDVWLAGCGAIAGHAAEVLSEHEVDDRAVRRGGRR